MHDTIPAPAPTRPTPMRPPAPVDHALRDYCLRRIASGSGAMCSTADSIAAAAVHPCTPMKGGAR
jgi:hypothetical protein